MDDPALGDDSPRPSLDRDAWVVRGGVMEPERVRQTVETHARDPRTNGEYGLSVSALPGADPHEIVEADENIKHRKFRAARVGDLLDAGFAVVEDGEPHALVVLADLPDDGICEELRALFSVEHDNPFFEERRPPRGS